MASVDFRMYSSRTKLLVRVLGNKRRCCGALVEWEVIFWKCRNICITAAPDAKGAEGCLAADVIHFEEKVNVVHQKLVQEV